jgi:hypothetical protein
MGTCTLLFILMWSFWSSLLVTASAEARGEDIANVRDATQVIEERVIQMDAQKVAGNSQIYSLYSYGNP